jgi:hypothetical protein
MAIEGLGVRYVTTQTQSFKRAPMGELGVSPDYVPYAQVEALDKAWINLANEKFFKLINVPKTLTAQFNALYDTYEKWRDNQVDIVRELAPGFAGQQKTFAQAQSIYTAGVAAGGVPEKYVASKISAVKFEPTLVTAGTGAVLIVLGLAFVLLTTPPHRRRMKPTMAGLGQSGRKPKVVNIVFPSGHSFTRFRVFAKNWPEKFGHLAEDGSGWVLPDRRYLDRFYELLRVYEGREISDE